MRRKTHRRVENIKWRLTGGENLYFYFFLFSPFQQLTYLLNQRKLLESLFQALSIMFGLMLSIKLFKDFLWFAKKFKSSNDNLGLEIHILEKRR